MAMNEPFRAIILRFANDAAHDAIDKIVTDFSFEYVASVGRMERMYSSLSREKQHWFNSSDIRGGYYEGINSNDLLPLDEQLLEEMQPCEAVFMHLLARLEYARAISYEERKQYYLWHLRVWNDCIERHRINICISGIMPHEIPDLLVYSLCKAKGIPTLILHATPLRDRAYLIENWETSAVQVASRYKELMSTGALDIALSPQFEEYFQKQSCASGSTAITFHRPTATERIMHLVRKNIFAAAAGFVRWIPTLFSLSAWNRRIQKHAMLKKNKKMCAYYDAHAVVPDMSQSFIYVALHFQPECSTCPMAGAFVDQDLALQMLSACVPDDVLLYVKEHPKQREKGFACRSIDFYKRLVAMRNVRLVVHDADSFALREQCSAVATATGTAGFEALFREKPVLMFGHRFYQYAPGVYTIRTLEDCKNAMHDIFSNGAHPQLADVRVFLKAVEDTTIQASVTDWHQLQASDLTQQEHTSAIYAALAARLEAMRS